jgi:hypothetical protein
MAAFGIGGSDGALSRHVIVLVQFSETLGSRTFLDYDTLDGAMDGLCGIYEKELAVKKQPAGTYDIKDLYAFMDQLADVSLLVFHEPVSACKLLHHPPLSLHV